MTAHRRTRKTKTRSNPDDNSYAERYRQASDAAKAARAAAGSRTRGADRGLGIQAGDRVSIQIGEGASIKGISLVPEGQGTGYIISVGEERIHEEDGTPVVRRIGEDHASVGPFDLGEIRRQEALRSEAASHAASDGQREAAGAEGVDAGSEERQSRTFFEEVRDVDELAQAANGPQELLLAVMAAKEDAEAEYKRRHQVFFEAELNGLPTHVGSFICYCKKAANHWHELGEI